MTGAYAPDATGIDQNKSDLNTLYTTIQSGMLQVNYTLTNNSKTNIQLIDLSGRILYQQNSVSNAGKNSTSIATSDMKGIYLLRVITAEEAKTLKLELK